MDFFRSILLAKIVNPVEKLQVAGNMHTAHCLPFQWDDVVNMKIEADSSEYPAQFIHALDGIHIGPCWRCAQLGGSPHVLIVRPVRTVAVLKVALVLTNFICIGSLPCQELGARLIWVL